MAAVHCVPFHENPESIQFCGGVCGMLICLGCSANVCRACRRITVCSNCIRCFRCKKTGHSGCETCGKKIYIQDCPICQYRICSNCELNDPPDPCLSCKDAKRTCPNCLHKWCKKCQKPL